MEGERGERGEKGERGLRVSREKERGRVLSQRKRESFERTLKKVAKRKRVAEGGRKIHSETGDHTEPSQSWREKR